MVRDGIYYGIGFILAALLIGLLAPWFAVVPLLLAAFFLWFFRDPGRVIPGEAGAIVSCADGLVTDVSVVDLGDGPRTRISIFLNVFNVHVNRAPITGTISAVEYRRGRFQNAMGAASAELNEQNICTLQGEDGQVVVFKQIAGLLARRIVFNKKVGDHVDRGERVGLIKFGSRCDVLFSADALVRVKKGDKVSGGSSVLAVLSTRAQQTGTLQ